VKLGIDVVGALRPHTRAGRYTAEFVSALTRIDPGPEVVLFCNAFRVKDAGKVLGLGPPVVNPRIPGRVLLTAWRCLRWPPIDVLIGPVDGVRLLSPETVEAIGTDRFEGVDQVFGNPARFGLGFALGRLGGGPGDTSFGWGGMGGSFGYADPVSGMAVAYCKNLQTMDFSTATEIVELVNR